MATLIRNVMSAVEHLLTPDRDQGLQIEVNGVAPTEVDPPEQHCLAATSRPSEAMCSHSQRAHSDHQEVSEKYARLKKERNSLLCRVQELENTLTQRTDHLQSSRSTMNTLNDRLAATRAELVQARQDLQAARSFISTEASDDGKTLLDMLSLLNQKIDEFAYIVGDFVPSEMGEAHFMQPKTEKGVADMGPLETLGRFAIQTNLSIADVLQYGIQHMTCKHLEVLLMQFAPGINQSLSRYLNELHHSLCLRYPQAYSARWRAMTYHQTRPTDIECSGVARWWVEHIMPFVNICAPGRPPVKDALYTKLLEKAKEMFCAALALQDKARIAYLTYTYEVFAVDAGSQFKDREMKYGGEGRKKQKGHGEVVAVLGLGLKAWRSVCGDEGQYVRDEVIPVPVSVLTSS